MGPPLISFLQKGNFFGEDGSVGRLRGLAGAWGCPVSTPQGPGQMPNEQIHKGTPLNVRVKRKWVKPLKQARKLQDALVFPSLKLRPSDSLTHKGKV